MKSVLVERTISGGGARELLIFINGWGMDERPFKPLYSSRDILFIYDYSKYKEGDFVNFDFSKYDRFYLMGYSCGVYIAALLKDYLPEIKRSIAVNGMLILFDEDKGLRLETVNMFKNISMKNYMKFRRKYVVSSLEEMKEFNKNAPNRTVESSLDELFNLITLSEKHGEVKYKFDKVYVSSGDRIFPMEMQSGMWREFEIIEGAHFPFYRYSSFDELID